MMVNLQRASQELFRRSPDERFASLAALCDFCRWQKEECLELWQPPKNLAIRSMQADRLLLAAGDEAVLEMNDWSFSQLCRLAGVQKDTVNRLTPDTAQRVLAETLPRSTKPLQLFAQAGQLRSIHPPTYTRLHSSDLLAVVREFAVDFQPPQQGIGGATGLYGGEQDMFCFLIDPTGWIEIGDQAFAPGFFVWNSEVGCRTVGIEAFWFQAVCQNHIVWDAVEVVEFTRKHTAGVGDALGEIRRIILRLVEKRDQRRDQFARLVERAMRTRLGADADEALKILAQKGIRRTLAKKAVEIAQQQGGLTIFALIDALTRIHGQFVYAGDRTLADQQASQLLALAV